jgi:hypothetical protein
MQRQQKRPQAQEATRRSVGELLLSWLLILGGAAATALGVSDYLRSTHPEPVTDFILYGLFLGQALFGFLGGVLSLLRSRMLTRWSLYIAGAVSLLTAVAIIVGVVMHMVTGPVLETALFALGFVFLASVLFFLGRWLGRQDD